MTKFSFEVPIKHLSAFDDLQDFTFVLSYLCENPVYERYLREKANEGLSSIWIDNSFNELETSEPLDFLLYQRTLLNASRIIAPDHPKWGTDEILNSYRHTKAHISSDYIIVVVSSMEMYKQARAEGARNFAVSYWTREGFTFEELKSIPQVHFLGLLNIPELQEVRPISCDTSMPVKLAMKGMSLTDWAKEAYPHIHTKDLGKHGMDFFNAELTLDEIKLARRNTWELKETVNTKA